MSMCDLCNCVFTLSDGQANSTHPWAFLPGHQKESAKETLGEGAVKAAWKRPRVSHSWVYWALGNENRNAISTIHFTVALLSALFYIVKQFLQSNPEKPPFSAVSCVC